MTSDRYRRSPAALWRNVGTDVLVAATDGGDPELLAGPAAHIWRLLDTPRTVSELAEQLTDRYEARAETIADDVSSFLADLNARGYVEGEVERGS